MSTPAPETGLGLETTAEERKRWAERQRLDVVNDDEDPQIELYNWSRFVALLRDFDHLSADVVRLKGPTGGLETTYRSRTRLLKFYNYESPAANAIRNLCRDIDRLLAEVARFKAELADAQEHGRRLKFELGEAKACIANEPAREATARAEEREACAKIAEDGCFVETPFEGELWVARRIADAIRARSALAAEQAKAPPDRERLAQRLEEEANIDFRKSWLREAAAALRLPAPEEVEALATDRERLGRVVREAWIKWAKQQPNPKPSWLVPWDGLSEPDREVDRQIAEAVMAATPATGAGAWMPIETAPKDGTRILVTNGRDVGVCEWCERYQSGFPKRDWFHVMLNGNAHQPTHWQPLPAPPSLPDTEGKP